MRIEELRNALIEAVKEIEDEHILMFLCDLINSFKEKWGI